MEAITLLGMRRSRVESSSVSSVGYDAGTRTLEVEFRDGRVYRYFDVPASEYARLRWAPSLGAYLNTVIKQGYRCARV